MPTMGIGMSEALGAAALYRMLAWLSPGFPVGAFSYSHGLEAAVQSGSVRDRGTLQGWIGAILAHGAGRMDTDTFRDAHRAASAQNLEALTVANRRGVAFRATPRWRSKRRAGRSFRYLSRRLAGAVSRGWAELRAR
jgi:urease accessory protein